MRENEREGEEIKRETRHEGLVWEGRVVRMCTVTRNVRSRVLRGSRGERGR